MYCPTLFREERLDVLHELIQTHPLALLVTAGTAGPEANLIPFSLHPGAGCGVLRAHLARGNRQLDALRAGGEVLVVFQGPATYVTPSWYPSKAVHGKAVPTWNYAMVQARGTPQVIEAADWLLAQVTELTGTQESRRADPWRVDDAPADYIAAQLKGIVGVEIPIRAIEGKWKMSQNRTDEDRQGVIDGLAAEGACPALQRAMAVGRGPQAT